MFMAVLLLFENQASAPGSAAVTERSKQARASVRAALHLLPILPNEDIAL
jgi:hypothetical protein